MNALPQSSVGYRSPRARPESLTHAVLRLPDGGHSRGELQVISVTGGLLSLSRPLNQGSRVNLMFLTSAGAVQGAAEMLSAISWGLQPFRFVALTDSDQRRLRGVIESAVTHSGGDDWIDRYRARMKHSDLAGKKIPRGILATLAIASVLACSALLYYGVFLK